MSCRSAIRNIFISIFLIKEIFVTSLQSFLVFLGPGLRLVDGVDMLPELGHVVVVLRSQGGQATLLLDVGVLELLVPLLVEVHLGAGVGASLVKTTTKIFLFINSFVNVSLGHGDLVLVLHPARLEAPTGQ